MNRRIAWMGAIAGLAGAAGVGLSMWRTPGAGLPPSPPSSPPAPTAGAGSIAPDLWGLQFEQPQGGALVMAARRGRWTLLNFWATWCPPCVKELPMLDAFHRQHGDAGWQVIGLAIDGPTPVRQFLARAPVSFAVGLAGLEGIELVRALGNTSGALPFTVVLDPAGSVVERKLGELVEADLSAWVARHGARR